MINAALTTVALLTWIAAAYKFRELLADPKDPVVRAFTVALTGLALGNTVLLPPCYDAIYHLTTVPNLARLLGHELALASGYGVQALLLYLSYPPAEARPRARRRFVALLVMLAAMAAFFVLAPLEENVLDFAARYAEAPWMSQYTLTFLSYLTLAFTDILRLSWRYARHTPKPWLRFGLRLLAVGGAFGLLYCAYRGGYVAARQVGLRLPGDERTLSGLLVAASTLCMVLGSTIPAWGPYLGDAWRWGGRYRAYQRLRPLWLALYGVAPEIALELPRTRFNELLAVRDLDLRLYRRVIEIRDGRLALRPYLWPGIEAVADRAIEATGLTGQKRRAAVEAARLTAAIRAKASNATPRADDLPGATPGGDDLAGEIAWLVEVARAQAGSAAVAAALAQIEAAYPQCGDLVEREIHARGD